MNYLLDAIWLWKAARPKIREEWGLGALTDEQLAESLGLLLRTVPYKKEAARLKKDYGVVIQPSSLGSFYREVSPFILTARRRAAVATGDSLGEEMRAQPRNLKPQIIDLIQQCAVEVLADPVAASTSGSVKTIVRAVLKLYDLEAKEQQFKFDREKFAVGTCELFLKWFKDEKAKAIASSNVSNAEKISQLRQTYFADVDALEKSGAVVLPP
jgi:hypothetical protein